MKQTCILVLGMHRSGTSALTGVLDILGINLGQELMQAHEMNEKGFFENERIYNFNDQELFPALKSTWDDIGILKDNWQNENNLQDLYKKAKDIILSEYKNSNLFAIKDPRICILFPFWEKILKNLNIDIKVIIPLRNPIEVAISLEKRDGFKVKKSLMLWTKHVLYAEYYSREYKRLFVDYNVLLSDTTGSIKSIQDKFNLHNTIEDIKIKLQNFLDANLKHHSIENNDLIDTPSFINLAFENIYLLKDNKNEEIISSLNKARKLYELHCDFFINNDEKTIQYERLYKLRVDNKHQLQVISDMALNAQKLKNIIEEQKTTIQRLKD